MNIFIYVVFFCGFLQNNLFGKQTIEMVWGEEVFDDQLIEELLECPAMQRLKYISQSGPAMYLSIETPDGFYTEPHFDRYEHSVGVCALLKRAGAPFNEQVAGLLHDVSHTAFSHFADILFDHDERVSGKSYQDFIHEDFLEKTGIADLVERYGISRVQLNPDHEVYSALERPHPELCADRIQYIIHTGVIFERITSEQARSLVENLIFEENHWTFTCQDQARIFADLSLYFTKSLWGSPQNYALMQLFSIIFREAFVKNVVTMEDFHFGIDTVILDHLYASNNTLILNTLKRCVKLYDQFIVVSYGSGTHNYKPKFRGVDPLIKVGHQKYIRLTELDPYYAQRFKEIKKWCEQGFGIVFNYSLLDKQP